MTILSVAQVTSRLQSDAFYMTSIEAAFIRRLEEKQGPIPLYRRITKLFTPGELADLPVPGSKPPEQEKGEKDHDYNVRLSQLNAQYDWYPERTHNGTKIPAGYKWKDISDGLNNDNIEAIDKLSKLLSTKVSAEEKAVIRAGSPQYKALSLAQLRSLHRTATDRRSTYRNLTARAFKLHLQMQRIDDDYPAVEVMFHTVEGSKPDSDGFLPVETTAAPILIINKAQPIFGQPFSVSSFLRLNVDRALAADTQPGTYDALLESGSKVVDPSTSDGGGEGKATYGVTDFANVFSTASYTLETKEGRNILAIMLAEKDNDDFVKSFGRTLHAMRALYEGQTARKFERLIREEEEAEEKEKARRKVELEEALAKDKVV